MRKIDGSWSLDVDGDVVRADVEGLVDDGDDDARAERDVAVVVVGEEPC